MQSVAESWLVFRLTKSSTLLGTVAFCALIPSFVLAPFGGLLADRFSRRRILIVTQTLSMILAFILAGLTITGAIRVWQVMLIASLLGIVNAFDMPARQAFVVEMVGREDLTNAIALNSSMFNGARVIGPAIAGIVVAAIGEGWCFFANAVSYVAVITTLLLMRVDEAKRPLSRESAFQRIAEGFRFVRHTAPIRALLLLIGAVSLVGMPYATLMPVFADSILNGGAKGLGILMAASGVGALLGSLALASREGVRGLGRWVAISAMAFGVWLIAFSFSRNFWLSAALLVFVGASMMVQMASSNTLIQVMVPDALRGRVMALYSMMFLGMAPFGALFAGALAAHIGAPHTIAIGGVVSILAGAVFAMRLPQLRDEAVRLIVSNQVVGGDPVEEMIATPPLTADESA
jgi:MFS family permease